MMGGFNTTGIAGAGGQSSAAAELAVRRMLRSMSHRGPDLIHVEPCGDDNAACIGLVAKSTDQSDMAGMPTRGGEAPRSSLVIDGCIYNLSTLEDLLHAAGVHFRPSSPNGIVQSALDLWGEAAIAKLHGQFAIAYYDANRKAILLARDPLGVKTLHFAATRNGGFAFGSEIRALLASKLVNDEFDPGGIAIYLAHGHQYAPRTIHRYVTTLPAGHYQWLALSPDTIPSGLPIRYWQLPEQGHDPGEQAVVGQLCRTLDDSVAAATRGVPRVSTYLPGDIESSVIATLACRSCRDVRTSFVEIESEGYEERARLAAAIAGELNTRHFQMIVDQEWSGSLWQEWMSAADTPCVDGYEVYVTSQAVESAGAAVALYPNGGAELFRGVPIYGAVHRLLELRLLAARLPRWLRPAGVSRLIAASSPVFRDSLACALRSDSSAADVALNARRVFFDGQLESLGLSSAAVGLTPSYLPSGYEEASGTERDNLADQILRMQCLLWIPNRDARICDVNGMANSIELRLPYLDQRFIETLVRIPRVTSPAKMSRAGDAMHRMARTILPYNLLHRREPPPSFPLRHWLTGPLREYCGACVDLAATCPALDGAVINEWWTDFLASPRIEWLRRIVAIVGLGAYMREAARITQSGNGVRGA
jgi:asparagine synthase (glutamine-hydrolysing)